MSQEALKKDDGYIRPKKTFQDKLTDDDIEKKLDNSKEKKSQESDSLTAYCVKCKTKRIIKDPEETVMKNGRIAITGNCDICNCKVFRIGIISKE